MHVNFENAFLLNQKQITERILEKKKVLFIQESKSLSTLAFFAAMM
jgi:hypothetical protein